MVSKAVVGIAVPGGVLIIWSLVFFVTFFSGGGSLVNTGLWVGCFLFQVQLCGFLPLFSIGITMRIEAKRNTLSYWVVRLLELMQFFRPEILTVV